MAKSPSRIVPALAALSGLIAVAAGAFAAHGISDPHAKELLRTGAQYELAHALAVFACVTLARRGTHLAAICLLAGATLFSWSLYALALGAAHIIGMMTPIGGLLMLAGWAIMAGAAMFGRGEP